MTERTERTEGTGGAEIGGPQETTLDESAVLMDDGSIGDEVGNTTGPNGDAHVDALPLRATSSVGGWFTAHARALIATIGLMVRAPIGTALTAAIVGIALALPLGLYLTVDGLSSLTAQWDQGAQISVFLRDNVSDADATALARTLTAREDVYSVDALGRGDVLADFERLTGLAGVSAAFENKNPLPAVLVIKAAGRLSDPTTRPALQALVSDLRAMPRVEFVEFDTQWLARLNGVLAVVNRGTVIFAALLVGSLLLVVGNVVRVMVEGRRDEVEIARLVGATDAFVKRPFLYTGAVLGLLGAVVGWLVLFVASEAISEPLSGLVALYPGSPRASSVGFGAFVTLLLAGALIGWLGAWVAATRQLRSMEP